MTITLIGSCLSGQILKSFPQGNGIEKKLFNHLRSDVLYKLLDNTDILGCPSEAIDEIYSMLTVALTEDRQKKMLIRRMLGQSTKKLSAIEPAIAKSDILIFDNNYDLGRNIHEVVLGRKTYRFSNLNIPARENVTVLPTLTANEIHYYEVKLLNKIVEINPNINIFFFNYPVTGFEKRGNRADLIRVNNTRDLNLSMKRAMANSDIPENVTFVGCIDVDESLLSSKGVLYFKDIVYQVFSRLIEHKISANSSLHERYFDDFSVLQKQFNTAKHPYRNLPPRNFWKPAVAELYPLSITNLYRKKFKINQNDAIATCGSCFAQHLGKQLKRMGFTFLDVEPPPSSLSTHQAKALGYGIYSARYGNVYTSSQLLQLFQRAFGELQFDEAWTNDIGRYVDPFRPNLCGDGHLTIEAVLDEQREHLQKVRSMFESLNIFIFTMGVTEAWLNSKTGSVYPICPGITAGNFNSQIYSFKNLNYSIIFTEMESFIDRLRQVNPLAKILLTVSPIPLTATVEDRHILLSTMASKSILRAVADELCRHYDHVDYFPSYDIVMSPPFKGMFFKNNLRSIHEGGVDYIMSHFFTEHMPQTTKCTESLVFNKTPQNDEAFCDEVFLDLEQNSEDY